MSISSALNNALSGLTASGRMAEVVSSNVSNALTDGYGRRQVNLSSATIGGMSAGVRVDGITRHSNPGLIGDRRLADADVGRQQRSMTAFVALAQEIGDIGDPAGLAGRVSALEQSLISAASDPASDQRLGAVINRLGDVTSTLRSNADSIRTQRERADSAIANDVDALNTALQQVKKINADINRSRNSGVDPSALIDARQIAIDNISSIVPVREVDRGNGQVALITLTGATLLDGTAAEIGFTRTPTIVADMTLASGALSGLTLNGDPVDLVNGFGRLGGGSLSASFTLRDSTLVDLQGGLDEIAADLVARFAGSGVDPTQTAGDPGLLTDSGTAFDPLDLVGLSSRLEINASVNPAQGGAIWRLRDGVNAGAQGALGNSAQLDRWAEALRDPVVSGGGTVPLTAAGRIASFTSELGSLRITTEEQLSFETARWETLRSAELTQGVDTDQELQQLLRIEQAYAANAKVMQTVDFLIQRLMEL